MENWIDTLDDILHQHGLITVLISCAVYAAARARACADERVSSQYSATKTHIDHAIDALLH